MKPPSQELGSQDSGKRVEISEQQLNIIVQALVLGSPDDIEGDIDPDDPVPQALIWLMIGKLWEFCQFLIWTAKQRPVELDPVAEAAPYWRETELGKELIRKTRKKGKLMACINLKSVSCANSELKSPGQDR
jgi:hypothetical protein